MNKREQILEEFQMDSFAFLDPDYFDDAIVGIAERCGLSPVVLYDRNKCIELLIKEGMPETEALEHFDFNVIGSFIGDETPLFATFLETEEDAKQGFFIETPTITGEDSLSEEEEAKQRSMAMMEGFEIVDRGKKMNFVSPHDPGDENDNTE